MYLTVNRASGRILGELCRRVPFLPGGRGRADGKNAWAGIDTDGRRRKPAAGRGRPARTWRRAGGRGGGCAAVRAAPGSLRARRGRGPDKTCLVPSILATGEHLKTEKDVRNEG